MEQYLIAYNFKNSTPKTFQITKEQYFSELAYQIKLAEFNPNKATTEEVTDGDKIVEVISFYDPDDADFPELQLVKIISIGNK